MTAAHLKYRAARAWTRTLARLTPRAVYVVDLSGLDPRAVRAHLRRCCAPALCCAELIADAMAEQDGDTTGGRP